MKKLLLGVLIACVIVVAGCEKPGDLIDDKKYRIISVIDGGTYQVEEVETGLHYIKTNARYIPIIDPNTDKQVKREKVKE
ncbi:hypothetical protein M3_0110 [Lysinibacillus phage vB_LfM_LysYB1]|nr:hypothetical protein M3_0110 [Lysinibacillus phage vB_LfM_LysYB1]WAB25381.1 hypothetical protein M5_0203 [Lysinibacillus phage vB_LfM_LysYB2]